MELRGQNRGWDAQDSPTLASHPSELLVYVFANTMHKDMPRRISSSRRHQWRSEENSRIQRDRVFCNHVLAGQAHIIAHVRSSTTSYGQSMQIMQIMLHQHQECSESAPVSPRLQAARIYYYHVALLHLAPRWRSTGSNRAVPRQSPDGREY